ncbi:MAG: hypothetical protein AB7T27_09045 [Kiritimatiellia bacterium]
MIDRLEDYMVGIATGVRFRANFSIEDQLGQIVDRILYSRNSYFNPSIFPIVRGNVGQKTLSNDDTADKLQIDNSNIILELQFGTRFSAADLDEIHHQFEEEIIKGVMKTFAIKEIMRLGYITRYVFPMQELAKTFVDKTIGKTLGGVNDINLRFSKKLAIDEALVKAAVNDHNNAIFNIIKKADRDEIFMSVDFQTYYDPFLPGAAEIEFEPFIKQAQSFTSRKYLPWLNANYIEA